MSKVITRFPPSPTGHFHVGSARTMLFNYLFAKQNNGTMILRFEDTDKARSKKEYEENIIAGLAWLGIDFVLPDIPRQSERTSIYQPFIQQLLDEDNAYEAEEAQDSSGKKVIRFRNPNKDVSFTDLVRGEVTTNTKDLGDFVIAKSIDEPLYHLAVVIDDHEMGVTHIIRGEDHISNTPRQLLIQEALSFQAPTYAHIPVILGTDKKKLSKRHGAQSLLDYKKNGYLPEAMINFLALLGWHPEDEQEIFSLEELVAKFDLSRVQKGGAVFDTEKLRWINKQHMEKLSPDEFLKHAQEYVPTYTPEQLKQMLPILRERAETFGDLRTWAEKGEFDYYFTRPTYTSEELIWKDDARQVTHTHLTHVQSTLENIPDDNFTAESIKAALWNYATEEGRGSVFWPLRYALSGKEKSPDPFTLAEILGKKETHARISQALAILS